MALEGLDAFNNEFAELPAGITALSRLTELTLGRIKRSKDPLQVHVKRPLNAVALGDLSGFPALCKLSFYDCEVKLYMSMLDGAVQHRRLSSILFSNAHPTPECAPMVLQLSQQLRRSSMLDLTGGGLGSWGKCPAQDLPPFYKFQAALGLCAL